LETHAQKLFESFGGFGRGFERKWVRADKRDRWYWGALGTGQFGTGANMAFRRKVFDEIGLFDPALDVGTVTNGGGDLEMFFRVLNTGHTLAYEPAAIVRHRHRRKLIQLRTQLKNNGCGLFSYIFRSVRFHPDQIRFFARLSLWYLLKGNLKPFLKSPLKMGEIPRIFYLDQLLGSFQGALAYWRSQNKAQNIERKFGPVTAGAAYKALSPRIRKLTKPDAIGIRQIDLVLPLMALNDVKDYATVRVFVRDGDHHLGSLDISNDGQTISANRLREEIVRSFGLNLLDPSRRKSKMSVWSKVVSALSDHLIPSDSDRQRQNHPRDSAAERISVVVATLDRPADLGACLQHLLAQKTTSEVEIIVVDNNPASGLTAPVVAQYPGVALVKEPRKGLAYARNAGFLHCTGEIAVATDDDVTMPEDWLRKLTAPFARPEVMIVTGNVLPLEIENRAQALFERYGGLGRGFERFEIGPDWFGSIYGQAVPTWTLGATANAAFRTCIFKDPQIGLMEETLGPGMPSGVGEDTYLFYKVLKAGHIIAYEPAAFVWHKHRRDMNGLRHQLYNYSKGHVAYHLTTFMNDCDVRALLQIFVQLPLWRLKQLLWYAKSLLKGNEPDYPFSLTLTEIIGNAVGPFVLWKSHQRVKREGRSVSRGCKRAKFRPSEIN
jgi:glycosyltransferase involved in cell wall biosynthesis